MHIRTSTHGHATQLNINYMSSQRAQQEVPGTASDIKTVLAEWLAWHAQTTHDNVDRTYHATPRESHCDVGRLPGVEVVLALTEDQRLLIVCRSVVIRFVGDVFADHVNVKDAGIKPMYVVVKCEAELSSVI